MKKATSSPYTAPPTSNPTVLEKIRRMIKKPKPKWNGFKSVQEMMHFDPKTCEPRTLRLNGFDSPLEDFNFDPRDYESESDVEDNHPHWIYFPPEDEDEDAPYEISDSEAEEHIPKFKHLPTCIPLRSEKLCTSIRTLSKQRSNSNQSCKSMDSTSGADSKLGGKVNDDEAKPNSKEKGETVEDNSSSDGEYTDTQPPSLSDTFMFRYEGDGQISLDSDEEFDHNGKYFARGLGLSGFKVNEIVTPAARQSIRDVTSMLTKFEEKRFHRYRGTYLRCHLGGDHNVDEFIRRKRPGIFLHCPVSHQHGAIYERYKVKQKICRYELPVHRRPLMMKFKRKTNRPYYKKKTDKDLLEHDVPCKKCKRCSFFVHRSSANHVYKDYVDNVQYRGKNPANMSPAEAFKEYTERNKAYEERKAKQGCLKIGGVGSSQSRPTVAANVEEEKSSEITIAKLNNNSPLLSSQEEIRAGLKTQTSANSQPGSSRLCPTPIRVCGKPPIPPKSPYESRASSKSFAKSMLRTATAKSSTGLMSKGATSKTKDLTPTETATVNSGLKGNSDSSSVSKDQSTAKEPAANSKGKQANSRISNISIVNAKPVASKITAKANSTQAKKPGSAPRRSR